MSTLISVHSEGCVGRCDAKCYNAKHDVCVCICGGRNHGVGHNRAVENTRQLTENLFKKFPEVKLGNDVLQRRLF